MHERALKMAETDATKRALATFGRPFGLALYVSGRNRWSSKPQIGGAAIADDDRRRTLQRLGPSGRYYVPARTVIDPAPLKDGGEDVAKSEPPRIDGGAAIEQLSPDLAPASHHDRALTPGYEAAPAQAHPHDDIAGRSPQSEADDRQSNQTPSGADAPPLQPSSDAKQSRIETAALLIERPKRRREPAHLKFVGSQPCLICGRTPSDAHHLRFAQPRALGRKVSDEFTVPLCRTHHRQVHQTGNEVQWWQAMDRDVDPLEIAKGLWEQSRKSTQTESESTALLRR